jgi:hypothetical protein
MAYKDEKHFVVETLVADRITRDTSVVGSALTIGAVTLDGTTTLSGTTTISGALATTGALTTTAAQHPSTAGPTTGALTAAMSGRLCVGAIDADYDLPAAANNAGVWYTFITGTVSAGTGVAITATAAVIQGKTTPDGGTAITNATTITNTGATDVVGDMVTLRCDGTNWWMTSISGIWA